jgi:hypothetical protein
VSGGVLDDGRRGARGQRGRRAPAVAACDAGATAARAEQVDAGKDDDRRGARGRRASPGAVGGGPRRERGGWEPARAEQGDTARTTAREVHGGGAGGGGLRRGRGGWEPARAEQVDAVDRRRGARGRRVAWGATREQVGSAACDAAS